MIATLFVTFILLLACSFPIAVSQSFASMFLIFGDAPLSLESFTKAIMSGFSSFTLVAIPLFTFAGDIMGKGGISKRLINVAKLSLGNRTGGLGIVSIVACMIFAAISGTGSATVAAIGLIMIPEMLEAGYDRAYSASLVATAGTIGTIIPPSICMVVYAIAAGCSVTAMFTAGFPVGILVGAVLCIYCALSCRKRGYKPVYVKYTAKDWVKTIVEAIPSFLVPVIILGGIYGGIFTPTEAAAAGCVLGVIISVFVYKEVKLSDIPYMAFRSVIISAPVMFIIGVSTGFGRVLAITQMPSMIAEGILGITSNSVLLLILINLLLLLVGTFMETNAAIIILTPILLPIVTALGINPIHFGMIMILNLAIGFITPPLGANLFMASEISRVKFETLAKTIWPWIGAMIVVLIIITYIPQISLFLPQMMGLLG
ncbi:TRAP transporter large permease [Butyricicoccus pullicaecorum]|uniref:TRAP transporter, DctM subunit n=1 Tax=Butyricicoccus pullicaecorum 1.2 TaxID=1203606 RepID=R8VV28_9FIRM|nr:TRAP transporter large permease [Butyricicoccus pullicaecorum]EOQ36324.1 TRAP transporter, DctM subunit [Butyricicoccus pullicaecorum 1.2]MDY2970338.1 TRAP transporter large permease [Butyricicoccus pullicaecorum]SKA64830.1 C4-dicarboxylate transporter, DctM subunit [Butyricicoccus pullicaecorum DSM 23266]